jgi:hypothetical protein
MFAATVETKDVRELSFMRERAEAPRCPADVETEPVDDLAAGDRVCKLPEASAAPLVKLPRGDPELGDDIGEEVFPPVSVEDFEVAGSKASTTRSTKGSTSRPWSSSRPFSTAVLSPSLTTI